MSSDYSEFRRHFPVLARRAFLFAGGMSPMADVVRDELHGFLAEWEQDPVGAFDRRERDSARLRRGLGALLGVDAADVTITTNTSEGSNRVISMMAEAAGDVVLVDDTSYPTSIYPWLTKSDKRVEYFPRLADPPQLIDRLAAGDVAAVALSHVGAQTGFRHDLGEIGRLVHAAGALLLVDVAQSAGCIPVAAMDADAIVGTCAKWLLGPAGVGFLWIAPEVRERLRIRDVGYLTALVPEDAYPRDVVPAFPPGGASLELGIPATGLLAGAAAGVELILNLGPERIEARVLDLVAPLLDELVRVGIDVITPQTAAQRAGVVFARTPQAVAIRDELRQRGVDIGGWASGMLRIDPHAYNDETDIAAALDGIRHTMRRG